MGTDGTDRDDLKRRLDEERAELVDRIARNRANAVYWRSVDREDLARNCDIIAATATANLELHDMRRWLVDIEQPKGEGDAGPGLRC